MANRLRLGRGRGNEVKAAGPPAASGDRQCRGRTVSGEQCRLWAGGGGYCKAHRGQAPEPAARGNAVPGGEVSNGGLLRSGSMTAAVARIQIRGQGWQNWSLRSRSWQREAWRLYDITGPLRFVVNSVAKTASKAKLFVGEIDESGDIHVETLDPEIRQLAQGPLGAGESRKEAIRLICVNLQVAGEAFVVAEGWDSSIGGFHNRDERGNEATPTKLEPGQPGWDEDRWFVVSSEQMMDIGGQIVIRRPGLFGGGYFTPVDERDILMRVWIPHPVDVDEPDSPVRSAIPDLRELEALRKREFAELDSRLAGAGILWVPDDIDFPQGTAEGSDPADPAGVSEGGLDGFLEDLGDAMGQSLQDRSSGAAMVPIGAQGNRESIAAIRHMTFWTELSEQILPMKDSTLRMLAMSLDAPVEMMQGMGQTNHWSAWLLDEQTISTHIEPLLSQIANALTRAWLEPVLRRLDRDPKQFSYAFNTASLQVRGDKTNTALELHERRLISDDALREVTDFDDALAPSAEERLRRMVEDAIRVAPTTMMMDPDVRRILGLNPEVAWWLNPSADGRPPGYSGPPSPSRDQENTNPEEIPDVPDPDRSLPDAPRREDDGGQAIPSGLVAAADLAVLRALELAGGRLVPKRPRDAARHELHTWATECNGARAEWALTGAWAHLPGAAQTLGVRDPAGLERLLHEYCKELIVRRVPHERELLRQLLQRAFSGTEGAAIGQPTAIGSSSE